MPGKKNVFVLLLLALLAEAKIFSQQKDSSKIEISGYVDAYYAFYTDSVGTGNFQKFPSVSPRSNHFGLNVAMLTAKYSAEKVRGVATVHFGDIPLSAWSAKYNFIQEANAGIRLHKKLWLDGGFFRTHFGTEALFPRENYTSSVTVGTYFEPYYEAGFRLNYNPDEKLSIFLYALNGYGIYEDNNKQKSAGLLITYVFSDKFNIGYSGYYGDDSPDSVSLSYFRQAHNVFLNFKGKKFKYTVGGDVCWQQHSYLADNTKPATMWSAVSVLSYLPANKFRIYTRQEIFNDPNGIVSGAFKDINGNLTGYKLWGITAGVEYKPTDNSYIRLEGRQIETDAAQEIFHWKGEGEDSRTEVMLNVGVSF
ncbi:MAG: outer membrane beta-barrel protein [Bacteroidetes bacterium]|nr:outer membrane beta-barrel protein [Bacteroidota bacterium]